MDRLRLRAILAELDRLELSVKDIEGVIAAFVAERPELRRQLDHLLSIPGVSLVVGAGLLAAIGSVSRFDRAKQLAAYFGLVPSTYQSGDTRARHGRITKTGRSDARWLAGEAAEHLRKAPGPLRSLYQRICAKRGHNVAVVAVARKLAELCWHLLTKGEDYLYNVPRLTQEKRARVRYMAKQKTRRKVASAAMRPARPVLYGSGLQGRQVTTQVARQAAEQAEAIYNAIVTERKAGVRREGEASGTGGFDPTRPTVVDWQKVLEGIARRYAGPRSRTPRAETEE